MNRGKWANQHHSTERWLAKLTEEVGEVGRALSDRFDALLGHSKGNVPLAVNRAHDDLIEELGHVIFIATCWREQLKRERGHDGAEVGK